MRIPRAIPIPVARAVVLPAALLLLALPVSLAAQDTTVADKVLVTAGAPAKGYFLIGPTVPFTASDGRYISTPATKVTLAADGSFSVKLAPTTTATPANASYTAEYHITNAGTTQAQYTESWVVPPSAIPLRIKDVLVPATAPPPGGAGGGGTAQPPAGQLPDTSYTDLGQACQAASNAKQTLLVTKSWQAITTQTLACDMLFYTGGMLQPAAGAVITIGGGFSAQLHQVVDTSLGGNGSIIFAPNSVPAVYPQWFGVVMGKGVPIATQNQNLVSLDATQHAVSGQGIPVLITGRIEYNDPQPNGVPYAGLQSMSNMTWRGTNASSEIVASIVALQWGAINFCGTYPEATTQNCMTGGVPPAGTVHGINPAYLGATQLVANPTGGFSNVTVGSWIMVGEGPTPYYNTFRSYHTVTAVNGDTITLDRPLEFDFAGASDLAAVYGVTLINPLHDVTVENLKITQAAGANSAYLVFFTNQAANVTFRNCTFASEGQYDAEGYACWSFKTNLYHNTWQTGGFDGWCGGSWGIEDGDTSLAVIGAMNAGNGANHVSVVNSFFAGPTTSPDMISGPFYHATFANNQFTGFKTTPVITIAGFDVRFVNNSLLDGQQGIAFENTALPKNSVVQVHDILIANNYLHQRGAGSCISFPSTGVINSIVGIGNIFNCKSALAGFPGDPAFTTVGNINIRQAQLTGTVTIPGYTNTSGPMGGLTNTVQLSNIPIAGGMLRSMNTIPSSGETFNPGDIVLLNPVNLTGTNQNSLILFTKTPGSVGTMAGGCTATTVAGSNVVTFTANPQFISIGKYYAIAGTTGPHKMVWQLSPNTWQMDSNANASVTSGAVSLSNPVLVQIQGRAVQVGTCALSAGLTCSSTFTVAFTAAPTCTATNASAAFGVQAVGTTTTITATGGTGSASGNTINWTCTGNPN